MKSILKFDEQEKLSKKDILLNEFHSIGFYMSDHPLNIYIKIILNDFKNKVIFKFY